jgi:hypothetical protein
MLVRHSNFSQKFGFDSSMDSPTNHMVLKFITFGAVREAIPRLRLNVLEEIHASHLGINKTKGTARSYIWWPNIGIHIENLMKGCKNCYNELQDPPKIEIKQWPPSKYV